MNKTVYLALSISDLSKTVMYEFWYDYVKPKYGEKARLCYMDTDSFIVYVRTDDIYKHITEDLERRIFFFNWDSLHARLNSHYKAWRYKKKKHKKIKAYRKSL